MNRVDHALLEFTRQTGRMPMVIYLGCNLLNEIRMCNQSYFQLDIANKLYHGIPWFRVANEDDHLAIY